MIPVYFQVLLVVDFRLRTYFRLLIALASSWFYCQVADFIAMWLNLLAFCSLIVRLLSLLAECLFHCQIADFISLFTCSWAILKLVSASAWSHVPRQMMSLCTMIMFVLILGKAYRGRAGYWVKTVWGSYSGSGPEVAFSEAGLGNLRHTALTYTRVRGVPLVYREAQPCPR